MTNEAVRRNATTYPSTIDRAILDTANVVRQNRALLVAPEPSAEVDADRMLVQSRLAQ